MKRATWGLVIAAGVVAGAVELVERRVLAGIEDAPDDGDGELAAADFVAHRLVTPDGGRLHVEELGRGPAVVLLHGHGATLGTFAKLAPRLAGLGHRVVAIDQRGFGRSSAVPDGFTFRGLVDDVAVVLEALELEDAIVVGHSMGGTVALGLTIQHPETTAARVGGLVLLSSTARGPADDRRHRALVTAMDWPGLERLSRHPRHGMVLTRANFGAAPLRRDVEATRQIGLASPIGSRRGFARRLLGTDLSDELGAVGVPVLALAGSADRVVAPRESERLVELLPDARLQVLHGAGHMLPMERATEAAHAIDAFAAEVRTADER